MSAQFWLAFAAVAALVVALAFNLIRAVMRDSGRCVHCGWLYPLAALPTHEDDCVGNAAARDNERITASYLTAWEKRLGPELVEQAMQLVESWGWPRGRSEPPPYVWAAAYRQIEQRGADLITRATDPQTTQQKVRDRGR